MITKYHTISLFILVAAIGALALLSTACGVSETTDKVSTSKPIEPTNTPTENGSADTLRDTIDSDVEADSLDSDNAIDMDAGGDLSIDTDTSTQDGVDSTDTDMDDSDDIRIDKDTSTQDGADSTDTDMDDEVVSIDADSIAGMDTSKDTTLDVDTPPQANADTADDDALREAASGSDTIVEAPFPPSVGDTAPTFTLPSVLHGDVSLSSFREDKAVVLVFYRAYWCTACRKQLNEINNRYEDFKNSGAEVLAITTDNLENTGTLIARSGYDFPILYTSRDNTIPKTYDRFNKFGDSLASAAIFLIDTDGRIVWEDLGTNAYHFARSDEILKQLNKLST